MYFCSQLLTQHLQTARKILLIFIALWGSHLSWGQARGENYFAQKWVFDINFPVGLAYQQATVNFTPNFMYPVNAKFDNLKLSPAFITGVDCEFGYYFGKKKLIGFGTGIQYIQTSSNASLDNYHVEYEATDAKNQIYRQVVSNAGQVQENLTNSSFNIPIVAKFKQIFNKYIGFSADAGILLNFDNSTSYISNSSFNYEAIYAYAEGSQTTHVYDNNPTPNPTDWLITVENFQKHNPSGSVENYFDSLSGRGYKVGLGLHPNVSTGKISHPGSALGFIFRPAVNIRFYERLYLYLGGFISYQGFNNTISQKYRLVDNFGNTYSSMLGAVSAIHDFSIGGNIGVRVFLGKSNIYIPHKDN